MKVEITKIKVGKRIRKDPGDIDELAQSIKQDGLLSPISLRKIDNKHYKLLAGWRRLEAFKVLQWTSIESIIKNPQ